MLHDHMSIHPFSTHSSRWYKHFHPGSLWSTKLCQMCLICVAFKWSCTRHQPRVDLHTVCPVLALKVWDTCRPTSCHFVLPSGWHQFSWRSRMRLPKQLTAIIQSYSWTRWEEAWWRGTGWWSYPVFSFFSSCFFVCLFFSTACTLIFFFMWFFKLFLYLIRTRKSSSKCKGADLKIFCFFFRRQQRSEPLCRWLRQDSNLLVLFGCKYPGRWERRVKLCTTEIRGQVVVTWLWTELLGLNRTLRNLEITGLPELCVCVTELCLLVRAPKNTRTCLSLSVSTLSQKTFKEKQHVSVDLKSGTPVWADLQSLSLHAKAASGIKQVIKESLVTQISHAYGVMSESGLRERSAEKPFQVEARRERGLSSHWSHSALIQFWIVFDSRLCCFFKSKLALIHLFICVCFVCFFCFFSRMHLLGCKQATILKSCVVEIAERAPHTHPNADSSICLPV